MFEDWNGIIAGIVLFIGVALGLRSIRQVRQVQRDRVRRARDELRQRGT